MSREAEQRALDALLDLIRSQTSASVSMEKRIEALEKSQDQMAADVVPMLDRGVRAMVREAEAKDLEAQAAAELVVLEKQRQAARGKWGEKVWDNKGVQLLILGVCMALSGAATHLISSLSGAAP